jgi:hypothetical protein
LVLARSSGDDESEARLVGLALARLLVRRRERSEAGRLGARSLVRRRERSEAGRLGARSFVRRREQSEAWCSLARQETRAKRGLTLARSSGDESEARLDARSSSGDESEARLMLNGRMM